MLDNSFVSVLNTHAFCFSDFGYKISETMFANECVRDEFIDASLVHRIPDPCPPGTFYTYTHG